MNFINQYKKYIIIVFGVLLIVGGSFAYYFYFYNKPTTNESLNNIVRSETDYEEEKEEFEETIREIFVDVKGAVVNPGVIRIAEDKLVMDAINLAGGKNRLADSRCINLSMRVRSEMVIYVHTRTEVNQRTECVRTSGALNAICPDLNNDAHVTPPSSNNNTANNSSNENQAPARVNINTANAAQLQTLPGVGPARANDIINYRTTNGLFTTLEDLMNVSGIGQATFDNLRELITI